VIAEFPKQLNSYATEGVEEALNDIMLTAARLRSQLSDLKVASNAKPTVAVRLQNTARYELFQAEKDVLQALCRSGETTILKADEANPEGSLQGYVNDEITIFVKVIGLVNIEDEIARIAKRVTQLEDFKAKMAKKMSIADYENKVPEKVR